MPSNIVEALRPLVRPIGTLKALDGNPRRGDVESVARSYQRFGQRKPIVARADGTVIAGNHQLQAAVSLGWDEIAVVVVDDDEITAKAFALADNRTSDLGSYDDEALADLLIALSETFDDMAATGYTPDDIAVRIVGSSSLLDDAVGFLDGIDGEVATLESLATPEHDFQTLAFVMPAARKQEILNRLREIMEEHSLDTMSDALYFGLGR